MLYYSEIFGRNKKKYRVELLTDGDRTEQQELQMVAGSPIVRIDGTEDIFTPLHGGSASITIRTDELLPFYTTDPMGVSATIYEDDSLLFYGYVTPNMYSSVWMPRKTDLTIECRDALSVLADLEYDSDSDTESFADLLTKSLEKVGGGKMTLDVVEPFDKSLINLSVIRGNWFDEGGEAMKWSDVLASMLQWCGCRLTQWRDKWYVNDFRHVRIKENLDSYKCLTNPTMSLTEVHQKNKLEVSLYEDSSDVIDAFEGWEELKAETYTQDYFNSELGEPVSSKSSFLIHYSSPNITQYMYSNWDLTTPILIDRSGDAMASQSGAWLVTRSDEFGENPTKYIVITTPHQSVPWRDKVLNSSYSEPYTFPVLTIKDPVWRVFTEAQSLLIKGKVLMSTIPAPLLSDRTKGKFYNAENGSLTDFQEHAKARMYVRLRVGDKVKWINPDGLDLSWEQNQPGDNASFRIALTFGDYDAKNPFQQGLELNETPATNLIGGQGYRIPLEDGLEGNMEIDIFLYTGRTVTESLWISELKISLGYFARYYDKFVYENSENSDIVYENEIKDTYTEPYEKKINLSTSGKKYNYSRSAVYENTSGVRKPVGDLNSNVTGERAIAEHHLLNAITLQNQQPRMVLEGTWRNLVASPVNTYVSANLGKTFIVESLEVDCDASTSTMKLEELYG